MKQFLLLAGLAMAPFSAMADCMAGSLCMEMGTTLPSPTLDLSNSSTLTNSYSNTLSGYTAQAPAAQSGNYVGNNAAAAQYGSIQTGPYALNSATSNAVSPAAGEVSAVANPMNVPAITNSPAIDAFNDTSGAGEFYNCYIKKGANCD